MEQSQYFELPVKFSSAVQADTNYMYQLEGSSTGERICTSVSGRDYSSTVLGITLNFAVDGSSFRGYKNEEESHTADVTIESYDKNISVKGCGFSASIVGEEPDGSIKEIDSIEDLNTAELLSPDKVFLKLSFSTIPDWVFKTDVKIKIKIRSRFITSLRDKLKIDTDKPPTYKQRHRTKAIHLNTEVTIKQLFQTFKVGILLAVLISIMSFPGTSSTVIKSTPVVLGEQLTLNCSIRPFCPYGSASWGTSNGNGNIKDVFSDCLENIGCFRNKTEIFGTEYLFSVKGNVMSLHIKNVTEKVKNKLAEKVKNKLACHRCGNQTEFLLEFIDSRTTTVMQNNSAIKYAVGIPLMILTLFTVYAV